MTTHLSAETEKLIQKAMTLYPGITADEIVREAIRAFLPQRGPDIEDLDEETQAAIAEGLAQLDRGETIPVSEVRAFFNSIRTETGPQRQSDEK